MNHFIDISPYKMHPDYTPNMPHTSRFVLGRGHAAYKLILDCMNVVDVKFNPYDDHWETMPFEKICQH
jgi:hypothetical protein